MKNKLIYLLLVIILLEGLFFAFRTNLTSVKVDSGWDSSYSSSSSSSGGGWSSSSSSSSYSHDRSHGSSSPSRPLSPLEIFSVILVSIILVILFFVFTSSKHTTNRKKYPYDDMNVDLYNKFNLGPLLKLKKTFLNNFIEIQNAWMNFDYDTLAKYCSNELYNSYKSDLEILKLKNGKNVMFDFTQLNMKVYDIKQEQNCLDIYVYLHISFYDYVIDTLKMQVIRGNKLNKVSNHYLLIFRKNLNSVSKCPSCGADITTNTDKCSHCGNIIVNNNTNYVLISKGRI